MGGPLAVGEEAPRSAGRLVLSAFGVYRRYPLLFLVLAAGVIVPYEAIVLALTGSGPFTRASLDPQASLLLSVVDVALIGPLVSALHVHAVREMREGGDPRLAPVARQGLKVLPVVAAATIVSWLGIAVGFLALAVPGVYLSLRWCVVAQAAAIEDRGWLPALRRSGELAEGYYGHVFAVLVCTFLIVFAPAYLIELAFDRESTDAVPFLVGTVVQVCVYSFGALVTGLLYFDLRARHRPAVAPRSLEEQSPAVAHPWDLDDHPPEERPSGWYVDPGNPDRMRYWEAGDSPGWTDSRTRTPAKIKDAWVKRHLGR